MKGMIQPVLVLAVIYLFSIQGVAQTVRYVSTSGSDSSNNCSVEASPCATIQAAIDSAAAGDTISVAQGAYSESLTLSTSRLVLKGAQFGVDAKDRSATESEITGYINITGSADSVVVDGFSILEGAAISGSKAGIYIGSNAINITLQNNLFTRSGTVDGDTFRGIVNAIGGSQTGLIVQNNSFTGWATGIYLNPGPKGAQLLNNELKGNFVGVSVDGPDSTVFTGNSFEDNVFEGLGIGPWTDSGTSAPDPLVATFTSNSFVSDDTYIGLYSGSGSEFDFSTSSFEGVTASTMTNAQLLAAEEQIGHGVDASGGYSGFASLRDNTILVTDGNSVSTALGFAAASDAIIIGAGSYSKQTIDKDDLSFTFSSGVSGIDSLKFESSINDLQLVGNDSALVIVGNGNDNNISISGDNITVDGGEGSDTITLSGNRPAYTIKDNTTNFSFNDGSSNSEATGFEFAAFDDITIALSFAEPVSYPGRSIAFGDNSSTLSIPDDNSLDATTALSIEFWMKTSGFSSTDQSIIKKGSDAWSIHRYADTNFLAFTTYHSSTGNTLFGDISITDDAWHHIAVVFDGTNKSIFIDGKLDASTTISGNLDTNSEAISVGGWTGSIDDLRFWDTALDSTKIRNNGFQPLKGDESGLQGYWRMDEGSGSLVGDFTTNSNDAYIPSGSSISWNTSSHPIGSFITGDEGWRILTSPADGITYGELLDGIWTQGFTGADSETGSANAYTFTEGDGDTDASSRGFQAITSASATTTAGEALLVYVYADDDPDTEGVQGAFPKTIQTDSAQHSGTITPSLTLTKSGAGGSYDATNDGWNMVGNPFASSLDWDASSGWSRSGLDGSIYVWSDSANSGTGAYLTWNGSSGTLGSGNVAPMQGFWVKANDTGAPSFSVNDTARSNGAVLLKLKEIPEIQFKLSGEGMADRAIVMFSEEAEVGKDPLDAYKLASINQEWLAVYTATDDGAGMDIQSLPVQLESPLELNLVIEGSNLDGEYALSWNHSLSEEYELLLLDTETEMITDLQSQSSYEFTVEGVSEKKSTSPHTDQFAISVLGAGDDGNKSKEQGERFKLIIDSSQLVGTEEGGDRPGKLQLDQNYPNPFNPTTTIGFYLPVYSEVRLEVFDLLGRRVTTLVDGEFRQAGPHSVQFNAQTLSSGVYFYKLSANSEVIIKKMNVIK